MTFVGKILVIVIMAFALLFLGISTVVFTTHVNWKDEIAKNWKPKVDKLTTTNTTLTAELENTKKDLATAETTHAAAVKAQEDRLAKLDAEIKQTEQELTTVRGQVEGAQQNAKSALAEAEARRKETDQLREQKSAVEKQANDYKLQQTELNDKIRELERMNNTLDANTKDLRDKVARFATALRQNGLSDDVRNYRGLESPPAVQGIVERIDPKNQKVEISIGSDDGLVPGHELYLYRTQPQAEYLGKIKVTVVDPDRAVGVVIGNTVQGKKIQEGDIVSSTIRPRS
jgi:hypothetical protein